MSQRRKSAARKGPVARPADAERARLLRSLATLLESGIDVRRAFAILARDAPAPSRAALSHKGGGAGPAAILEQAGLLAPRERPRVEALDGIGRLDQGLALLAGDLEERAAILSRIRARMALPAAIWVLALFIAPVPGLFTGELNVLGYFGAVGQPLLLSIVVVWLAWRCWPILLHGIENQRLAQGRPPGLGRRRELLQELGRSLEAGLDAGQALGELAAHYRGEWGRRLAAASRAAARGRPVVASLEEQGLLGDAADVASLEAGEASGRLAEAMLHRAATLTRQWRLRGEMIGEWLPRGIYLLVLIWLAIGLIGGGGVGPSTTGL